MSDKAFLAFLRTQPSCLPRMAGDDSPIEACHVRRARNSGVGMKPEYSAVPMTARQHRFQHQNGETVCVNLFLGENFTREQAHDWFDIQAAKYLKLFMEKYP